MSLHAFFISLGILNTIVLGGYAGYIYIHYKRSRDTQTKKALITEIVLSFVLLVLLSTFICCLDYTMVKFINNGFKSEFNNE